MSAVSVPDRSHVDDLAPSRPALPVASERATDAFADVFAPAALAGPAAARGRWFVPALMALIAVALFAYTWTNAPVVPVWDGWTWIAHAKALQDGGFTGLLAAHPFVHAQHVYALPSTIALLLGPLFDYSFRPFAFLCVALLCALGLLLYRRARVQGLGRYEALAVFAAIVSFRHYENLILGFQFGLLLCVFLGAAAVVVASERRDRLGLLFALLLALGALLSSSAGLLAVVAVFVVRWFDHERPRVWIAVGLAMVAITLVLHGMLLWTRGVSFVAQAFERIEVATLPTLVMDAARLVGGGLATGTAAAPLGLLVLSATCARIAVQSWSARRLDALSGIALFGLLAALTVDVARSPFAHPESRHAIFAAPMVGVFAIDCMRYLRTTRLPRAFSAAALVLGCGWLQADAGREAVDYQRIISEWELDTRLYLATTTTHGGLSAEEIARVNPGPTEEIHGLMEFLRDQRWSIFSPRRDAIELQDGLPTHLGGTPRVERDGAVLQLTGPGYVYEPSVCRFPSGGTARLSVDVALKGTGTFGCIVRGPRGVEKANVCKPLRAGATFEAQSIRVDAAAGDTLEPYVFAWGPKCTARIRSFSMVLIPNAQVP